MMAVAVFCVFILASSLLSGQTSTIRPYSQRLNTTNILMVKNMCMDCIRVVELFSNILSSQGTQDLLQDSITDLCRHLPEMAIVNDCLDLVPKYLSVVIKGLIASTTNKETCMVLGLCAVQPQSKTPQLPKGGLEAGGFVQVLQSPKPSHELQVTPQCTFCLFMIKKLETMLPKKRIEESVVKVLEEICDHLPDRFKEQCNSFLDKYGKQLIDFLLTSATPHTICTLLHLCFFQESTAMVSSLPSDCLTCKILVILCQNSNESQMSPFLQNMCILHTNSLPGCELFIQRHKLMLVTILRKREDAVNACQKFFCMEHE